MSSEILTVQFGKYSNFIGAHWWNIQNAKLNALNKNEIDSGVFFRGKDNLNLNPRLIAVDLKGCIDFPSSKEEFGLEKHTSYLQDTHSVYIGDRSNTTQGLPSDKNSEWRALMNTTLHSNTLRLFSGYDDNVVDGLNVFPGGVNLMKKGENSEFMENQIRYFIEECDFFQGFNVLLDSDNGFGGVASHFLQIIKEEYPNKTNIAFPSFPVYLLDDNLAAKHERLTNTGLVIGSLFEDSCMLSPVSLDLSWFSGKPRNNKYLHNKSQLFNQTSAIIATALDAVLSPLSTNGELKLCLMDYIRSLTTYDRKAVGMSCAIQPSPFLEYNAQADQLKKILDSVFSESFYLTPEVNDFKNIFAQLLSWLEIANASKFVPVIEQWCKCRWESTMTLNTLFSSTYNLAKEYPRLFLEPTDPSSSSYEEEYSFPIYGGLHNSVSLGNSLRKLHTNISKVDVKKHYKFFSFGMEEDDFILNRENLLNCAENYDQ